MVSAIVLAFFWFSCGALVVSTVAFVVVLRLSFRLKELEARCAKFRTVIKYTVESDVVFLNDKEAVDALEQYARDQQRAICTLNFDDELLANEVAKLDTYRIAKLLEVYVRRFEDLRNENRMLKQRAST